MTSSWAIIRHSTDSGIRPVYCQIHQWFHITFVNQTKINEISKYLAALRVLTTIQGTCSRNFFESNRHLERVTSLCKILNDNRRSQATYFPISLITHVNSMVNTLAGTMHLMGTMVQTQGETRHLMKCRVTKASKSCDVTSHTVLI